MFTKQAQTLDELIPLFAAGGLDGRRIADILRKYTANCIADYVHRGSLLLDQQADNGRTDATLTVKRLPNPPETLATSNPSNGLAADFWGKVRFRAGVQFDQGLGALDALPAGAIILWGGAIANIPAGWALMDGVANASGTGINMTGVPWPYVSGDPTFGTIGAAVSIAIGWSGDPIAGSSTTSLTIASATTGISVATHSAGLSCTVNDSGHTHTIDSFTSPVGDGSATSPTSVVTSVDSFTGSATTGITVTTPALPHLVSDTGHSHTGTVTNSALAGNLTINTPNALRPAGTVVAYIEKLP